MEPHQTFIWSFQLDEPFLMFLNAKVLNVFKCIYERVQREVNSHLHDLKLH